MLPTPSHLKDCTIPLPQDAEECDYIGHVQCPCGLDAFQLHVTGGTHDHKGETFPSVTEIDGEYYLRVVAQCTGCGKEHLLLDADFHGWNGFVCREDSTNHLRPRPPLTPWPCASCGGTVHQADVQIQGEDLETATEESGGFLDETNWQDAFGWINIDIHCRACGKEVKPWISYETM